MNTARKGGVIDRIKRNLNRKKDVSQDLADSMCYLTTETSYTIQELRELDIGSFFTLIKYINKIKLKEQKELNKIKR